MKRFNWYAATLALLTSSAFLAYAVAEESANTGQASNGSSQASSNSSNQGQNQQSQSSNNDKTSDKNNSAQGDNTKGNAQSNNDQKSRDTNSSQDKSSQNQSKQDRDDRSTSDRNSNANTRDRDDRDSARSERNDRDRDDRNRDDRTDARGHSDRDDNRNADNRSSNSDRDSSRDRSSRRGNMRGPDIGIWFSRSSRDGLVIADVSTRGPIAKLGFHEGDRIVSVNGQRVTREDDFIRYLLRSESRRVKVIVLRDNREETIYVEPAVLIDDHEYAEVDPLERFGIILDDRYDDRIVVWRVIPRSPAYYAGFRPGDVIVTFSGRPYRTRTEFETGSREWKSGDVAVQIRRGDKTRDLSVEIPNTDRSDRRSERSQSREERTAERDTSTSDRSDTNSSEKNTNNQRDSRPGVLNGLGRGRGTR